MSARDMEKLEQAITVLQELLSRAKHEDKKAEPEAESKDEPERDSPVLAQLLEKLTRIGG